MSKNPPFPTFILEISSFVRRRDYNSFFKVVGQKALVLYYNQLKSCWWWWLDCNINRAYIFKKKHINSLLCLFFSLKESLKRGETPSTYVCVSPTIEFKQLCLLLSNYLHNQEVPQNSSETIHSCKMLRLPLLEDF